MCYNITIDHPEHLSETGFDPEGMFQSCIEEMEEMATQVRHILQTKKADYYKIHGPLGWFQGALGWLSFYGMTNKKGKEYYDWELDDELPESTQNIAQLCEEIRDTNEFLGHSDWSDTVTEEDKGWLLSVLHPLNLRRLYVGARAPFVRPTKLA